MFLKNLFHHFILKNILIILFFGILSVIFGEIKFLVPGYETVGSDLREIVLFISIIFCPHWSMIIGISFITSIFIPPESSTISMFLSHTLGLTIGWLLYHKYIINLKENLRISFVWIGFSLVYFYIFLMPIIIIGDLLRNIIKISDIWEFYVTLFFASRYEVATTTMVTTLFLVLVTVNRSLNEKIKWLDYVINKGNIGLWDFNTVTEKVVYNEQWYKMLGYSLEEMEKDSITWETLLHVDDKAKAIENFESFAIGKSRYYISEFRLKTKNGEWKWIQDQGKIVKHHNNGKPERITGIQLDISEIKSFQEAVLNEREKLAVSLESIQDLIISIDKRGIIDFVNHTAEKMFSKTKNDLLGQIFNKVYKLKDRNTGKVIKSAIEIALESKRNAETDKPAILTIGNSQEILITEKASPILNKENKIIGIILVTRNVTKKVRMEEQLNHTNKMDAIGQLVGGVAHDFNNMLGGIMNAAQLLKKTQKTLNERGNKYVKLILKASQRASDLTSRLLAFGRKGNVSSTAIDVHNIIDDSIAILMRTIDKKVKININKTSANYIVIGDNAGIQNALINLGINASHSMPVGGEISITTSNLVLSQAYCKSSPFDIDPGEYIEIEVRDTGCGISIEHIKKNFEPFFTTKSPGAGTGLGLAVVYGTVLDHHGEINVYSELGKGTSFKIMLPCTSKNIENEKINKEILMGTGQMILLVDDEELIRITGKDMLDQMGYKVLIAENGKEAVDIFEKKHKKIDLVLMDMIMPEMNGQDAFFKMKKIDQNCKIIISSGFTQSESMTELKKSGLAGFISKPFRGSELAELLSDVLKKS